MENKKTYNPFSLEGKNILVTGASSGIGRAIAVECSKMGANVIATARNETRLAETLAAMDSSGTHKSVIADLSDAAALASLVESIENPLDGVVQCAGLTIPKPFQFLSEDDVDAVMSVNFYAPVVLSRLLLKKKKRKSSIWIYAFLATRLFYYTICPPIFQKGKILKIKGFWQNFF